MGDEGRGVTGQSTEGLSVHCRDFGFCSGSGGSHCRSEQRRGRT